VVDAVLTFEGDQRSGLRVLTCGKNRFGPEGETAWFEMSAGGLEETDPTGHLHRDGAEPGCATTIVLAGRRALVADVQALVVPTEGAPRRHVTGLDPRRFQMVVAITERVAKLGLARSDAYGATAAALRIHDSASDLAVAVALWSASTGRAVPRDVAFVGELSLTGALRSTGGDRHRRAAATTAGLATVVGPSADTGAGSFGDDRPEHLAEVLARFGH
jgi:DNA repair protein RadA/Sms